MADRRKRGAPVGLMSFLRPRQRFRSCNRSSDTTAACCTWYICSSFARECCSTSCPCDQLPFTITIVHWTQLLYMVRSCSSARECCCIWYVVVVLLVICTYVVSLRPTLFGHNCCIWYVVVVLLVIAALRSVLVTNSHLHLDTTDDVYGTWL